MDGSIFGARAVRVFTISLVAAAIAACGGDDDGDAQSASTAAAEPAAPATRSSAGAYQSSTAAAYHDVVNHAPRIGGSAPRSVLQGTMFDFTPWANDPDGDILTFSIEGLPPWAEFSAASGRLRGTPGPEDVGVYAGIRISVTDGAATSHLPAFAVEVVGTETGSVTLTWIPPTQNTDGTPLSDLAGYKIYWGRSAGSYTSSVTIANPGIASYVVEQLSPGTWYFVATSFNAQGTESAFSEEATALVL